MVAQPGIAVYPGTFDPLTFGHVSLVKRGLDVFNTIILAIASDAPKKTLFTLEERLTMAQEVFQDMPQVQMETFSGLLVDYVVRNEARVILRGLRAVSDFEYEFQMALMNRCLNRGIQTVFFITDYRWLYISSTIIKEAAKLGGDVRGLVPDPVFFRLREKYGIEP
ncbi:Phosphopantetheine adenylyltransferase [Desulfovibrionales bacterium]